MHTSNSGRKLIVLTAGDPRGVGPEVILKSLAAFSSHKKIALLIIGDYGIFRKEAKKLAIDIPAVRPIGRGAFSIKNEAVLFMDLKNVPLSGAERTDRLCGRASMEYLSCGVSIVKATANSALVTSPISKAAINKAGYGFEGHTEFLAHETKSRSVTMMLIGGNLRVSLVTRHLPLKRVPGCITRDKIAKTVKNTHYALRHFFKIRRPRIGVAALNPHAGEGTLLGSEEKSIIFPAVRRLSRENRGVRGPFPADTLIYRATKGEFDAVVCMYHDQGLIPLKMLAFETGVNLTIGLPFIRTSPDHGTAFDIAGKDKANPSSMTEAIRLAAKLS